MTKHITAALVLAGLVSSAAPALAQDTLNRAKDYYSAAAYEEALQVLDRLRSGVVRADATEVASYEVFCFVALGRNAEAAEAVEAIVRQDPFYHPPAGEVSPRVLAFFDEVRRPLLPSMVKELYARAKTAFDRKEMETAANGFDSVMSLLDELGEDAGAQADLRTLAGGFRDLSRMAAPAPVPVAPVPVTAVAEVTPPPASPEVSVAATVVPPVAVFNRMPAWKPGTAAAERQIFRGRLDVMIDPLGRVKSATLSKSVHPDYDPVLLRTAAQWRYRPATKDGVPVAYNLSMEIVLSP